ncbi:MAG: response regulator [Planctomycetota bacterium]
MPNALSILCIDAAEADVRRLELCLLQVEQYDVAFHHQPDPAVALRRLSRLRADVILIDNGMPTVTGCEVIRAARAKGEQRPIIATACEDCGYLTADLLRAGADAFLLKRDLSPGFLHRVITRAISESRQRVAQVKLKREALRGMMQSPRVLALR